jgi:hypothetical protein
VLAFGVFLVAGLVVVPTMTEHVDAKCEGTRKNGDPCKAKEERGYRRRYKHIMKSETIMLTITPALAIALVAGLVVLPSSRSDSIITRRR